MTAIYKAGEALGFSREQVELIVNHWYLAGFLERDYFSDVLETCFKLPEAKIKEMNDCVEKCIEETQFNAKQICSSLLQEEKYSALALGLFEYFQQNHFTKGEAKEVSLAVDTLYTQNYKDEIIKMADKLGLLSEKTLNRNVDVALVIGGRAKTNQVYLRRLQEEEKKHQIGRYFIFLSTRLLLEDEPDNPKSSTEGFSYDDSNGKDYRHYLAEKYKIDVSSVTEGHAMQDRYSHVFGESLHEAAQKNKVVIFELNSRNAGDFYEAAIEKVKAEKYSSIGISSITPHIKPYEARVRYLCKERCSEEIIVCGYGPAGSRDPKILVQALAAFIDTNYQNAAEHIKNKTDIDPLPIDCLRYNSRDKTKLSLPKSYKKFIYEINLKAPISGFFKQKSDPSSCTPSNGDDQKYRLT